VESQVCCAADDLIIMGGPRDIPLRAMFVSLTAAAELTAAAAAAARVSVALRAVPRADGSMFLLWLLGCSAAYIAAWRSASDSRYDDRDRAAVPSS
jgi:hypothetical protein